MSSVEQSKKAGVLIPEPILYAAEREGPLEGITPEEWINRHITFNPNAQAEAEAFWRERRSRPVVPGAFQKWLDSLPDAPPIPGDELE